MSTFQKMIWVGLAGLFVPGCKAPAHYGSDFRLADRDTVAVAAVLRDRDAYDDHYLRVRGTVAEVCARKGCWLTLNDGQGGETVFVQFNCPIEGRLIPTEAVGHPVTVEGKLNVTEITEEAARHFAEDAGAGPDKIARIVGPQKQVQIASPAARVSGL